jgi:hypothetical protein
MNSKHKCLLIAASITFLICAIGTMTKPGSFSRNALWTLIYFGELAVVFSAVWYLLRTPKRRS